MGLTISHAAMLSDPIQAIAVLPLEPDRRRKSARLEIVVISTNVETVVGLIYRGCSRLGRLMLIERTIALGFLRCGHANLPD